MANLYDSDVAAWAEQQANALRRRAANELGQRRRGDRGRGRKSEAGGPLTPEGHL